MCKHYWKEHERSYYFDYDGFKITVIWFICEKCGRKKKKKYW